MRFSERHGHRPIKDSVQSDSMDTALRTGLWNILTVYCWDKVKPSDINLRQAWRISEHSNVEHYFLCVQLWVNYYKKPLDELSNDWPKVLEQLRRYFFECEWFEVYDFVEFVGANFDQGDFSQKFVKTCNGCLQKEMSAFRFVDGLVTSIIDDVEIAEIEEAAVAMPGAVQEHLRRALELLSDRSVPDYRNSIKESISAIESLVAQDVGKPGSLGDLLKSMEATWHLQPALKRAFRALYGYTSDEEGIRHAILEGSQIDFHDAKLMLILCSSFVNYYRGKSSET